MGGPYGTPPSPAPTTPRVDHDKIACGRVKDASSPFRPPTTGRRTDAMSDLIYLLVTVAFFALATGFVTVCDRIVGRDREQEA